MHRGEMASGRGDGLPGCSCRTRPAPGWAHSSPNRPRLPVWLFRVQSLTSFHQKEIPSLSLSPSVWKTQGRPWPTPTVDDRTGLGGVDVIIPGGEGVRGAPGEQGETLLEASVGCGAQKGTWQTRGLPAEQIACENGRAVRWGDAGRLRPGVAPEASTPPESGGQQMLGGICFRRKLRKGPRHPRGLGSLRGQDQTEQRTQPSSGSRHQ